MMKAIYLTTFTFTLVLLAGCGAGFDPATRSPEEIYARAVEEFKDNDMFEAQKLFDIIKLQHPTSPVVDKAQFYLAEINFKRKEYILAAYNYNFLRRMYPQSEFAKVSMLKAAQCYVELSPPFDRDQKYTREAIASMTEYRERYKQDTAMADSVIRTLRNKLAEREFRIAEQYRVLLSDKASLVYYDSVIDDFTDSEYCESSLVAKTEVLLKLKRYDEALSTLSLYARFFPTGSLKSRMDQLRSSIPLSDDKAGK